MNSSVEIKTSTESYQLYYDNRAFRMYENKTQRTLAQLQDGRISEMTALLWAGLLRHQPAATLETADSIIDDLGYEEAMKIVMAAVEQSPPFRGRNASK